MQYDVLMSWWRLDNKTFKEICEAGRAWGELPESPGSIVANELNQQTNATIFLGRVPGIVTYKDSSSVSHFVMIQMRTLAFILFTYI